MSKLASTSPAPALCVTVLLVVAQRPVRELIAANLAAAGFHPVLASTRFEGANLLEQFLPDAIVVDLEASRALGPGGSQANARFEGAAQVPTIMITSSLSDSCGEDRRRCGADVCVEKPFAPRQLVAQISSLLDANQSIRVPRDGTVEFGPLLMQVREHRVSMLRGDTAHHLDLSPTEFQLLKFLMANPVRVHTRADLLREVWGDQTGNDERTVDQTVKRVRKELHRVKLKTMLDTVRGVGYRMMSVDTKN